MKTQRTRIIIIMIILAALVNGNVMARQKVVVVPILESDNEKGISGSDYIGGFSAHYLASTKRTIRSIHIEAPAAGIIIATTSGTFRFNQPNLQDGAECSITNGSTFIDDRYSFAGSEASDASGILDMPFSATRGFNVSEGTTTIRLICVETNGSVDLLNTNLTGIFVPNEY